ncbi:MAG: sodium-dependent bicarbonate transport family permease [Anaerolineae bacterium]|nr:sodium-dependent bicarbonate transport family permease [Anaerolineae bacterium]MDW8172804.1 sodium-dependent bicarbonate transport family permease [Anaerolineae bacterium]
MELLEVLQINLLSPMVLAFVLGVIAVRVKSDLTIPDQVYTIISIYLLFSIGLKGGFDLAKSPLQGFLVAALVAVVLGIIVAVSSYLLFWRVGQLSEADSIALAIHYSGVSAVTLSAAVTFLAEVNEPLEGFMPTMYVIMELPAVLVCLAIASARLGQTRTTPSQALRSALSAKSFLLLGGGTLIGLLSGATGEKQVSPFFVQLFPGFLTLFLLEMGTLVGKRLRALSHVGPFLVGYGLFMPLVHGTLGVALGTVVGLSVGGSMLMGSLAASASYITAPAVVQTNIPQAQPIYYLTASLVVTFPMNLSVGLPIYYALARWMAA